MASTTAFALKLTAALALGVTWSAVAGSAPAGAGSPSAGPAIQRLVILERTQDAFTKPDPGSTRLLAVNQYRPITGAGTVLPLLGETTGTDGRTWLHVMLPGRPNSHTGWISPHVMRYSVTAWRLVVDISMRRVTVFHFGRVVRRYPAVVGKPSTPTPQGRFFVEETLVLNHTRVGTPFALALSARSRVLDQFDGGPGQIALHGLGNVGGVLGTAVSHGCMRLATRSISWLAARIGPGVPVTITG